MCPKKEHTPYGVTDLLDPPFLYGKQCCVRGEDDNCNGGKKCMVHPTVCKQYHSNTMADAPAVSLCEKCGIERVEFCPHLEHCEDLTVLVHVYGEVGREKKDTFNDELIEERWTVKKLCSTIKRFAPCYFSHYWELKHDAAVAESKMFRMLVREHVEDPDNDDARMMTLQFFADYASVFNMPRQGAKVCTMDNTANLEMFVVRYCILIRIIFTILSA